MRRISRATLNVALLLAPFVGNGCATQQLQMKNASQQAQDPQKAVAQQLLVAQREEARGNLGEARKLYTRIHNENPDHAECAHRLGLLYVKLNLHSEAEVFYRRALEISPNDSKILTDIGHLAFLKKDYAQSEEFLVRATNADSTNRTAAYNLAVVRAWMGEDESSLATFRNINDEHDALRNLATIQIARGDKGLGRESMRLAEIAANTSRPHSRSNESSDRSAQLVSAHAPDLAGGPHLLKPIPQADASARPQLNYQTANTFGAANSLDSDDIPPAPAMLPSETASALSSLRSSPKAIACIDPVMTSAALDNSAQPMITLPEYAVDQTAELKGQGWEEGLEDHQFELPHRSSLQIDFPEEASFSWEVLKRMEMNQEK